MPRSRSTHESQHYTGSNRGDPGMDVVAEPYVGDDVIADVAFLQRPPPAATGCSSSARLASPSSRAERLWGTELLGRRFPGADLARALAGVALPSTIGDTMLFASADAGDRKGIRGLAEEATLGIGIRLALGAAAPPPPPP